MFVFVVQDIREEKGVSIEELSEITGLSEGYICELENNNLSDTSLSKIFKIARVLKVNMNELYYSIYDYEKLREELHISIKKYGLNDKKTRRISDLLDMLLNLINNN